VSAKYRRTRPSRADSVAAAAVSVAIGAGVAAAAFYVTRLFLSREPLGAGTAVMTRGAASSSSEESGPREESSGAPVR